MYSDFILAGREEGHRKEFHQGTIEGCILGEDRFAEEAFTKASQQIPSKIKIDHILTKVCKHYEIDPVDLSSRGRQRELSKARSIAANIVRETEHLNLTELSRKLQRDLSGLSQAAARFDKKMRTDKVLMGHLKKDQRIIAVNTH